MNIRISIYIVALLLALWSTAIRPRETQYQYQLVPAANREFKLSIRETAVPIPVGDEVLVKVRAVSLNRRDINVMDGKYGRSDRQSFVPISDGAGEIATLGARATRFSVGDRVVATFYRGWLDGRQPTDARAVGAHADGMLSQYVLVREQDLLRIPGSLSFEEASTLPCAGLTAWNGLFAHRKIMHGDYVLIQGTGGISMFGLLFATAAGAKPIVTSSSDAKLARARALGAIGTVNYRTTPEWSLAVRKITNGAGVSHVLEMGGQSSIHESLRSLARGGQVTLAGWVDGLTAEVPLSTLIARDASINGFHVGSRADFEAMNEFIARHRIKPIVDKVFDFRDAQSAYDFMRSGAFFGKVVIRVQ